MYWILAGFTIAGGIAALWFFWDKLFGKSDPKHGSTVEHAVSKKGNIKAIDQTGRGALIREVEAEKDIVAHSSGPEVQSDPKVLPPRP
jgi:hypothetical protein